MVALKVLGTLALIPSLALLMNGIGMLHSSPLNLADHAKGMIEKIAAKVNT